ncbi:MAG: hypothetical protein K0M45_04155 [Candidatus Paracaedibacteraceae bacterium]|nr:hypothetical protein [Candidatus Paracaedibacteraceae bacterium]
MTFPYCHKIELFAKIVDGLRQEGSVSWRWRTAITFKKKGRYAMKNNNVRELAQPGKLRDQLTEVLRKGARSLVFQAVEAEFALFLQSYEDERLADSRK